MRILVISDTHIPNNALKLPDEVLKEAKDCDLCIHAGDFIEKSVLKDLSKSTKVVGVCGNMDDKNINFEFPAKQILEIEDVKIGLAHGRGSAQNIIFAIQDIFVDEFSEIDMFIYGHSHLAHNEIFNGKIYFNPGSPTDRVFAPYRSYGIIIIKDGTIDRRIIKLG